MPREVRWGSLVPLAALCVLVASGTIVTASSPHPGGQEVRRLSHLEPAIWWHVCATAVFGVVFLALARLGLAQGRLGTQRSSLAVLALLLVQMAVGETSTARSCRGGSS